MAGVTVTTSPPRADAGTRRPISQRLGTLAQSVHGTRRRLRFDIRQLLLVGGAVCIGIGFVTIVFGWYGAAHSAYLFQEIPYLISGGLLGVALVAGGGFLFFAAWIVRLLIARPLPEHSGQGSSTTRPRPRHSVHGSDSA